MADELTIDDLLKARELFNQQRITTPMYLMQVHEDMLDHAKAVVKSCGLESIINVEVYAKKLPPVKESHDGTA